MNNEPLLNLIIKNIKKNHNNKHIIILPDSLSRAFILNILKNNSINNQSIYYLDEYVFKCNKINHIKLLKKDISFLENIIPEIEFIFDKYSLTSEIENILKIIKKIFLEKNIFISEKNSNDDEVIKQINQNLLSYESKIFLEIIKLWIKKSREEETYINLYTKFLNSENNINNTNTHYFIKIEEFSTLEKSYIKNNIKKIHYYSNFFKHDIDNENFIPKKINIYKTYDFDSQEDEIDFLVSNIKKLINKDKNSKIALINNNRYFQRRLSSNLQCKNININDTYGWLLSTSSCCTYICNILDYFADQANYFNLHDIIMSPFFLPDTDLDEKKLFLDALTLNIKNNNEADIISYLKINNHPINNIFKESQSKDKLFNFNEFKKLLYNKLHTLNSYDLIKKDDAGKSFIYFLEKNNESNEMLLTLKQWHIKIKLYLEEKTFHIEKHSSVFYTDIKHASLYKFDAIYVSSMTTKNFPKKIINYFSANNVIYSDYCINSNEEQIENIHDFLNLSNASDSITLSTHNTDGVEKYTKSKFKIYLDYYIKNISLNIIKEKDSYSLINTKNKIFLDNDFTRLTYKDIENFNNCIYCFYSNKKFFKHESSILGKKNFTLGSYIHNVLSVFFNNLINNMSYQEILDNLRKISEDTLINFYNPKNFPYDVELWHGLLPRLTEYFYLDFTKKYNYKSEKLLSFKYKDKIKLYGKYDLSYSFGGNNILVDFKTGIVPSKINVLKGSNLQLPFYSILNSKITITQYLGINLSQNSFNISSFLTNEFDDSKKIIFQTLDKIFSMIENKKEIFYEKSDLGCPICGNISSSI